MRRSSADASAFSFGPGPPSSAMKALIGANVLIFFAQSLRPVLTEFRPEPWYVVGNLWVWQLGTYMFLHCGIFHILFMLALWMFGAELADLGIRYSVFTVTASAPILTVLFSLAVQRPAAGECIGAGATTAYC